MQLCMCVCFLILSPSSLCKVVVRARPTQDLRRICRKREGELHAGPTAKGRVHVTRVFVLLLPPSSPSPISENLESAQTDAATQINATIKPVSAQARGEAQTLGGGGESPDKREGGRSDGGDSASTGGKR